MILSRSALPLILSALFVNSSALAQVYDVAANWSDNANPNGVWSYREGANLLGQVPSWVAGGFPVAQPAYANAAIGVGHIPACMRIIVPPVGLDVLAGDVIVHSRDNANGGANGEGSIVWTAPASGIVSIAGNAWLTRDIGRSVTWILARNGTPVTSGTVFSGDPYDRRYSLAFLDGSGGAGVLNAIPVVVGDTISFQALTAPASPYGDLIGVRWAIAYGATIATSGRVGSGCGAPGPVPVFSCLPPVIGTIMAMTVARSQPNTPGVVLFSVYTTASIPIGSGCLVQLDPITVSPLLPLVTDATGGWIDGVPVPFVTAFSGAVLSLQAIVFQDRSPLGFALSNGCVATVGF